MHLLDSIGQIWPAYILYTSTDMYKDVSWKFGPPAIFLILGPNVDGVKFSESICLLKCMYSLQIYVLNYRNKLSSYRRNKIFVYLILKDNGVTCKHLSVQHYTWLVQKLALSNADLEHRFASNYFLYLLFVEFCRWL